MQPFDYRIAVQDPVQMALQGYMQGQQLQGQRVQAERETQLYDMEMQQYQANQAKLQQEQAEAQAMQSDFATFNEALIDGTATLDDVLRINARHPAIAEQVQSAYQMKTDVQKNNEIKENLSLASLFRNAPEKGAEKLKERIAAAEAAGDQERVAALKNIEASIGISPTAPISATLFTLVNLLPEDQFKAVSETLMPPRPELRETIIGDEVRAYDPTDPMGTMQTLGPAPVGTPAVIIDQGDKVDQTFAVEMAKLDAGDIAAVATQGQTARRNAQTLNDLQTALASSPSGAEAALVSALGNVGITTASTGDVQWANSLISKLIPGQRAPGSGPMSDKDIDLFRASLPRLINTPGGNAKILSTMIAMNNYMIREGNLADAVKSGAMTRDQYRKEIQALGNPLAEFSGGGATGGGSGLSAQDAAELDRLEALERGGQ